MKLSIWRFVGLAIILLMASGDEALAFDQQDVGRIRVATKEFKSPKVARASGWYFTPGLGYCFDNPGIGGMGYHFINEDLLDTTLEYTRPEALVYAPGPYGGLNLVAVEYIVPIGQWKEAGNTVPPTIPELGMSLHVNSDLRAYVLHTWIWRDNPLGMFDDWNPDVSCPKRISGE